MQILPMTVFAWSLRLCSVLASPLQEPPDCVSWHNQLGNMPAPSPPSIPALPVPSSTSLVSSSPAVPSLPTPSASAPDVVDSGDGHATYYSPDAGFGSCGVLKQSSDLVVAAPLSLMQSATNSNLNPHCCTRPRPLDLQLTNIVHSDQQVRLTKQGGLQTVTVTIMDTCPGCVRPLFAPAETVLIGAVDTRSVGFDGSGVYGAELYVGSGPMSCNVGAAGDLFPEAGVVGTVWGLGFPCRSRVATWRITR